MALVTPIALSQNAFDASNTQRFYFTSSGGDQVVKNKLTIRKQADNSVVYSNIEETYAFYQDVPNDTLDNGVYYNFYFNTYDFNGNVSEDSNVVLFWCYTEPELNFTNIPSSGVITTVSYNFQCVYNQLEGEMLESLMFKLYNNQGTLINSSGNIYTSELPPNYFEYTFDNLLEDTRYYIEVVGVTINGTEITAGRTQFTVQYSEPIFYEKLKLQNNVNDGNINIYTNLIAIDGYSNKQEQTFIDNMVDLRNFGDYVQWKSGFSIPSSFVLQILMKPCLMGNVMTIKNEAGTLQMDIQLKREIPTGESTVKDCFYVREYNSLLDLTSVNRSNYVDIINNNSYICLWIKKIGTAWDLRLGVVSTTENRMNWNAVSNVEYNRITDMSWGNETYSGATDTIVSYNFNSLYSLTDVKIYNGVFDNIYMSRDIDIEYTTEALSEWNSLTILCCNFVNTINAGNISVYVSQISKILIKKRVVGETSWLTIVEKDVDGLEDINIDVYDYFSPNHTEMEYAIVPFIDGAESSYIISSIMSCFNGFYITDGRETYRLYEGVAYGSKSHTLKSGVHDTLNGEYPIISYNSKANYKKFSVEGFILGYTFEETREISRKSVINKSTDLIKFLTNKKQKIIKDWNGNIYLGSVVDDITPTTDLVNGYERISFNFVEQGKYNNQTDYDKSELIVQ